MVPYVSRLNSTEVSFTLLKVTHITREIYSDVNGCVANVSIQYSIE